LIADTKARRDAIQPQLTAAQIVVLNKTDLVNSQDLKKVETAIRFIVHNSADEIEARVCPAVRADLSPTLLTNTGLFSLAQAKTLPTWPRQRDSPPSPCLCCGG